MRSSGRRRGRPPAGRPANSCTARCRSGAPPTVTEPQTPRRTSRPRTARGAIRDRGEGIARVQRRHQPTHRPAYIIKKVLSNKHSAGAVVDRDPVGRVGHQLPVVCLLGDFGRPLERRRLRLSVRRCEVDPCLAGKPLSAVAGRVSPRGVSSGGRERPRGRTRLSTGTPSLGVRLPVVGRSRRVVRASSACPAGHRPSRRFRAPSSSARGPLRVSRAGQRGVRGRPSPVPGRGSHPPQ